MKLFKCACFLGIPGAGGTQNQRSHVRCSRVKV